MTDVPGGLERANGISMNYRFLIVIAVAALIVAVPALGIAMAGGLFLSLLIQAIIEAIFATSVGLLIRQNGRITFGQAGFFGLAAYIAGLLMQKAGLSPELAIALGLAIPTILGFLLGLLIAHIPGVPHAMITLAVGQALFEVADKWRPVTGGDDGLTISLPRTLFGVDRDYFQSPESMFVICWAALVLTIVAYTALVRSHFGQLTEAIRDNSERAQYIGYSITLNRALIYLLSGFLGAVAGILFMLYNGYISPGLLHWSVSGAGLIMAIIGGPKYVWGPVVGAGVYFLVKELAGDFTEIWPAIVGGIMIAVTLTLPDGLASIPLVIARNFRARKPT